MNLRTGVLVWKGAPASWSRIPQELSCKFSTTSNNSPLNPPSPSSTQYPLRGLACNEGVSTLFSTHGLSSLNAAHWPAYNT